MDILLVDDELDFIEPLAQRLRLRGYKARFATNGEALLDQLAKSPPDVLVLDWGMPGLSGPILLERIHTGWPTLPLVILSGYNTPKGLRQENWPQIREVLTKPLHFYGFLEILEGVCPSRGNTVPQQGDNA